MVAAAIVAAVTAWRSFSALLEKIFPPTDHPRSLRDVRDFKLQRYVGDRLSYPYFD